MSGKARARASPRLLAQSSAGIVLLMCVVSQARIKLAALPERAATVIRLDNPQATLIEEERVLTLKKGLNSVDFSWRGVSIDADSIRLRVLDHPAAAGKPGKVAVLNVSYPPDEAALVWEISSEEDYAETVRISYLLSNIDRVITYKATTDKAEKAIDLKSYLVLRNFSGEDFDKARVLLDYGSEFEQGINHEETKQMLFLGAPKVPITKVWTFDAGKLPWDPEKLENANVGIPVTYRILNDSKSGLGKFALWGGKTRVFQDDGHESTILLGEDSTGLVPVGEKMEVYIGDSRDIVVTQWKMTDERINLRKNNKGQVILYDTDEVITAKIENFKDSDAVLTVIEHIPGQWDMEQCNIKYEREDAETLKFEIKLGPRVLLSPAASTRVERRGGRQDSSGGGKEELKMHYHRRNVRP